MPNEVRNLLIERAKKVVLRHDSPAPSGDCETSDLHLGPLSNEFMRLYVVIVDMLARVQSRAVYVTLNDREDLAFVRAYINGRDAKTVLFDLFWSEIVHTLPGPALDKVKNHVCRLALRRDWQLVLESIIKHAPDPVSAEAKLQQQETACPGS